MIFALLIYRLEIHLLLRYLRPIARTHCSDNSGHLLNEVFGIDTDGIYGRSITCEAPERTSNVAVLASSCVENLRGD